MHDQAKDFTVFVKSILPTYFLSKKVLDVGSGDINGNNRFLFENCEYDGNDVITANNVTIVSKTKDLIFSDGTFDTIISTKPTIICIFACLKHIDLCEKFPKKSISINSNGIMNVHNTLMKYNTPVHTVLFVSTDKACLPITTYGCSKAISEFFLQGIKFNGVKWVGVRYGNVLNSSGSIIPYLRNNSSDPNPSIH